MLDWDEDLTTTARVNRAVSRAPPRLGESRRDPARVVLALQHTIGNRALQRSWTERGIQRKRVLQRKESDDDFEPSGVTEWGNEWLYYGSLPGGPYTDQRIALDYDRIAPLPDPTEGADEQQQRDVFTTPARLEQLYHDATVPLGSSVNRPRALWFVGNIEAVAELVGYRHAGALFSAGCLTIYNCGVDWDIVLRQYSEATASGRRVRGIILHSFIKKCYELNLDLTFINNATLLLVALSAARGALNVPRPSSVPRPTVPAAPKPSVTGEPAKAPPAPETPPAKPLPKATPSPAATVTRSPAELDKYLEQQGLTRKQIEGLTGIKPTKPRAALVERLVQHFTAEDLKQLGGYLSDGKLVLSKDAVDALIDHIPPGKMGDWVRQRGIADVHGAATRLPDEQKQSSLQDDPKARTQVTDKPSPGPEAAQFRRGNFAHRFAEYILDAKRLPRPNRAEVRVELRDGTGDIIRTDRIVAGEDQGVLYEIKPAGGKAAAKGRAELPGRIQALQKEFPKKNGWQGEVVEYTRADVEAWLRNEARAAKADGRPPPDVAKIMKLFGF